MSLYIDTCSSFIKKYNWGLEKQIYILEKTAFLRNGEKDLNSAIQILKDTEKLITDGDELSVHRSFLIVIQGMLATHMYHKGDTKEAKQYFEKALAQSDNYGEHTFYLEYLHTLYAGEQYKNGDSNSAYLHMLKGKQINDSFLNPRKDASQGFISIKDKYREELNQRKEILQNQAIEIAEQKTQL